MSRNIWMSHPDFLLLQTISVREWLTPVFCGFIIFANLLLNLPNEIMSNSLQMVRVCGSDRHSFISSTSIIPLFVQQCLPPPRSYLTPYVLNSGSASRSMTSCCLLCDCNRIFLSFFFFFLMSVLQLCLCVSSYFKALKWKSSSLKNGTNQTVELSACLTFRPWTLGP